MSELRRRGGRESPRMTRSTRMHGVFIRVFGVIRGEVSSIWNAVRTPRTPDLCLQVLLEGGEGFDAHGQAMQ